MLFNNVIVDGSVRIVTEYDDIRIDFLCSIQFILF